MRIFWLIGLLALVSACSSYSVRCSKHLRPINGPGRLAVTAGPAASAAKAPESAPAAPAVPAASGSPASPGTGRP